MSEQARALPPRDDALGPALDIWPDEPAGLAQVSTGLYTERLPVAGMTIAAIRQTFGDRLDIDPNAQPVLDGAAVPDESIRVEPGQNLAFVRHAGEKGLTGDKYAKKTIPVRSAFVLAVPVRPAG